MAQCRRHVLGPQQPPTPLAPGRRDRRSAGPGAPTTSAPAAYSRGAERSEAESPSRRSRRRVSAKGLPRQEGRAGPRRAIQPPQPPVTPTRRATPVPQCGQRATDDVSTYLRHRPLDNPGGPGWTAAPRLRPPRPGPAPAPSPPRPESSAARRPRRCARARGPARPQAAAGCARQGPPAAVLEPARKARGFVRTPEREAILYPWSGKGSRECEGGPRASAHSPKRACAPQNCSQP